MLMKPYRTFILGSPFGETFNGTANFNPIFVFCLAVELPAHLVVGRRVFML